MAWAGDTLSLRSFGTGLHGVSPHGGFASRFSFAGRLKAERAQCAFLVADHPCLAFD